MYDMLNMWFLQRDENCKKESNKLVEIKVQQLRWTMPLIESLKIWYSQGKDRQTEREVHGNYIQIGTEREK